jgi:hypothetical protein
MCYATSWEVMGSSLHEITEFLFNLSEPSSCTMVLGFTQPLTEMSTTMCNAGSLTSM